MNAEAILRVRDLTKSFYGVPANDRVSFELNEGEVHGLLGENGAGKSTLCSILAGLYRPDSGEIFLNGERVRFSSPLDASNHGVGMVYQHFRLVPSLTVAENMILGMKDRGWKLSAGDAEGRVGELGAEYGLAVSPQAKIWQLSVGEQQRVEILRQLFRGARILILDEPTAVLAPQERDRLFAAVSRMTEQGKSVVLVSHKMEEQLAATDRVTVLRRGRVVGTVRTAETDAEELAEMIIGSEHIASVSSSEPRRDVNRTQPALRVVDLQIRSDRDTQAVDGVSFDVARGQVVGIAGIAGNGQRELQEAIAGLRQVVRGSIQVAGSHVTSTGPRSRARAGLAYVPEDRLGTGLAGGLTLEENLVLKSYNVKPHCNHGVLSRTAIDDTCEALTEQFDIRGAQRGMRVSLMSGGNLQKAILARELSQPHTVLVAASPTRGLDLTATAAVRRHILAEARRGNGVLLFSEDLDELSEMSDVILVMASGRVVGSYTPENMDIKEIGLLMTGAKAHSA